MTDQFDALAAFVDRQDVIEDATGRAHVALVAARQLRLVYARLSAALPLPAGAQSDPPARGRCGGGVPT